MGEPRKYGEYILSERISVGGMAEIFRARFAWSPEGGECFVIKKLLPQFAEDHRFATLFAQEARLAGQLDHPNIARVFELGGVLHDQHISMEYVPGPDLLAVQQRLRRQRESMPVDVATYVVRAVADALSHVHTHGTDNGEDFGLIHLDVTPPNILLSYAGEVKLIDFGIAMPVNAGVSRSDRGPKGKVAYMAPEVIDGKDIDTRSDLFSLGVVLHEALTGKPLFALKNDIVTMDRVRTARIKRPSQLNAGVPPALDRIVLKALARSTDERYQSATDLSQDLGEVLATFSKQPDADAIAQFLAKLFPKASRTTSQAPLLRWTQRPQPAAPVTAVPEDEEPPLDETNPSDAAAALRMITLREEERDDDPTMSRPVQAEEVRVDPSLETVDDPEEALFGATITEAPSLSKLTLLPPRAIKTVAQMGPESAESAVRVPAPSPPQRPKGRLLSVCVVAVAAILGVVSYHLSHLPTEQGALVALVEPADALILQLNGQELKATDSPLVIQGLLPGRYQLDIERGGFESLSRNFAIETDTVTTLDDLKLTPKAGAAANVRLRIKPVTATLLINNEPQAGVNAPERNLSIPTGRPVLLEAKAPGYQPGRRQITAAPGEDKVLEWELVPETVTLEVITEPPGMIYVNGNLEGRAPREIADLPRTAPVKLRLTLPGHETIEETVKLDGPDPVKVKRLFVKSEGNR